MDKGPSIDFSSRRKVRNLLVTYYFPYLFQKQPAKTHRDHSEEDHCLENQLKTQGARCPPVLVYFPPPSH
jgi:hypothetical protein